MKFIPLCYNKQCKVQDGSGIQDMNILFLEDEPTISEVLTEYMKMQNYNVTCAEDGGHAL